MADDFQVQLLKEGVTNWNEWRVLNPNIKIDLTGSDLSKLNLVNANLLGANLTSVNLEGSNLTTARLEKAKIISSNLKDVILPGAFLVDANLTDTHMEKANLSATFLTRAYLKKVNLTQANLRGANLIGTNLTRANLTGADLAGANLREANLFKSILCEADLTGATLQNAILVETDLNHTILNKCKVYGLSAWGLKGNPKEQSSIVITPENEAEVTVDDLQVAQFIYLLLNRENLRNVINTITSKAVLILGRFTPERKIILETIANELRQNKLLPIICDFDRPSNRDFTETIKILAGLSLFIIVDITNPKAIPLELQGTVPDYEIPFIPIIQQGERRFAMFDDLSKYSWMLPLLSYTSIENLKGNFKPVFIDRAWKKLKEIEIRKSEVKKDQTIEEYLKNLD